MRRYGLFWHIFPTYLVITVLAVVALSWYGSIALRTFFYEHAEGDLRARALLLEERLGGELGRGETESLQALAVELGRATGSRITVVQPDGLVVADTDEDPAVMENHADRPEIIEAVRGNVGSAVRYSHTLGMNRMYVAVPVNSDGEISGAVRVSLPTTDIDEEFLLIRQRIAIAALMMVAIAAAVSFVVTRRITRPLVEMRRGALRYAQGRFGYRLPVPRSLELASLSKTLNDMAEELDRQISTIRRQRAEQDAVFYSMKEGVIAVDMDDRLLTMNRAACELFDVEPATATGRSVQEVIRNTDIHAFVSQALLSSGPIEEEFELLNDTRRLLHVHGAELRDKKGRKIGAVIVLNDITRVHQLEKVRSDFVANVSHELRTPVTLIQGFVETLLDGAVDDADESRRFLHIVHAHSGRLNAIIEDLLYLSRIEQDAGDSRIAFDRARVAGVVETAIDVCLPRAREKDVRIDLATAGDSLARVNAPLLEHAVVNLLDNAVKYSEHGSSVEVDVREEETDVMIRVSDRGVGIAPEHLPRLFERFYRVDKARSRELGGTGLGLAIAKHIVQAHGGSIDVGSTPGKGSVFTIILPRA
jgi:two-component system phosphate regulon sensor histidine kinase PhoR